MANMTKKGARTVTAALDRIASLMQEEFTTLGVPERIAMDFAYRCDLISDAVERQAGLDRKALTELDVNQEQGFDPETIGEEDGGPLEGDSDEPYMKAEFTQQEHRELRERVQDGDLGMTTNLEEQTPQVGKQAEYAAVGKKAVDARLATACGRLQNAVAHLGGKGNLPMAVAKLAHSVMDVQMGVQTGTVSLDQADRTLKAVATILPHLANVNDVTKVASMVALANKIVAKKSEDEKPDFLKGKEDDKGEDKGEEDKGEDKPKAEPPKKGVVPPQFQKNVDKKKEDAKEGGKKAHGFDLLA